MSEKNAWDNDVYSTEYSASPLVRFSPADVDTRGLSIGGDDQLQWPVSSEQLKAWGCKEGAECSWIIEGPSLCWFTIDGVRVAKGERSIDGICCWSRLPGQESDAP